MTCLVHFHDDLTTQCGAETSRAARMALWEYKVRATTTIPHWLSPPTLGVPCNTLTYCRSPRCVRVYMSLILKPCTIQLFTTAGDTTVLHHQSTMLTRRHCGVPQKGVALTADCDADVIRFCSAQRKKSRGVWSIGAVGRCLSHQLALGSRLSDQCQVLVRAAAPQVCGCSFQGA